jgi:hypothetical protein
MYDDHEDDWGMMARLTADYNYLVEADGPAAITPPRSSHAGLRQCEDEARLRGCEDAMTIRLRGLDPHPYVLELGVRVVLAVYVVEP